METKVGEGNKHLFIFLCKMLLCPPVVSNFPEFSAVGFQQKVSPGSGIYCDATHGSHSML